MRKKFNIDKVVYVLVVCGLIAVFVMPLFGKQFAALDKKRKKATQKYKYELTIKNGYYESEYIKIPEKQWDDLLIEHCGYKEVSEFMHYFDCYIKEYKKILGESYFDNQKINFTFSYDHNSKVDPEKHSIVFSKVIFEFNPLKAEFSNEIVQYFIGDNSSYTLKYGLFYYLEKQADIVLRPNESDTDVICQAEKFLNKKFLLPSIGTNIEIPRYNDRGIELVYDDYDALETFSRSFVRYMIDTYGQDKMIELYRSNDLESSYKRIYGKNVEELKNDWIAEVNRKYKEKYGD